MTNDAGNNRPIPPGLAPFWTGLVSDFATLPAEPIDPALAERHRLYSLLTMAIVAAQFNGNKHGDRGDYGEWRSAQRKASHPGGTPEYRGGTYLGHNIAAIAVDARGNVVDLDFNHNEVFNSSVEHAESRLVRRLFSLAQIFDPWRQDAAGRRGAAGPSAAPATFVFTADPTATDPASAPLSRAAARADRSRRRGYGTLLADVSIYTSLESCAQCSGIMALAAVREVAYLQFDPGQYLIGNLMYRASAGRAPRPIAGDEFGFDWYERLNAANAEFAARVAKEPFFRGPDFTDASRSVTSFLCTDLALAIDEDAAATLDRTDTVEHADYRRPDHRGRPVDGALTNAGVLEAVKRFLEYARSQAGRGTPHRV